MWATLPSSGALGLGASHQVEFPVLLGEDLHSWDMTPDSQPLPLAPSRASLVHVSILPANLRVASVNPWL